MAEKKTKRKMNKLIIIIIICLVFISLISGLYYSPMDLFGAKSIVRGIELSSINLRFSFKSLATGTGSVAVGKGAIKRQDIPGIYKKIVIGKVDDESITYYGSYPIDRTVWADLLSYFNAKESIPDVILFDIIFSEPDSKPDSDKKLAGAFKDYKGAAGEDIILYNIPDLEIAIQKGVLNEKQKRLFIKEGLDYYSSTVQALKKFEIHAEQPLDLVKSYSKVKPMIPEIGKNLGFAGTVNMDREGDIFHKNPLIVKAYYYIKKDNEFSITNVYYPSIVLSAVTKILKSDISNISVQKGKIIIKNATYNGVVNDFPIPVDKYYRLSVNYKSTPDTGYLRLLPLKDVSRAGLPRNSILLIGVYVQGTAENQWRSPLGTMYSVDHMAYSIGTIMNRDFITELPEWLNILYILLFTFIIGLLVSRGIRQTIIAAILSIAIPFIIGFGLFQFNIQIITFIPLITSIIVLIVSEAYILLTEEREKRFIKTTFSKYVNPDLVNILIQNPDMLHLGGEDIDATILFSDIRGFTTLSEGMSPQELISFLNIYLSKMTDIVMETHGTLDKYIGDAVVAFWGTPIKLENHALNACQTAVKMISALKTFNEEQAKNGHKPINIGVGLNSGTITVGNVGSEKKKNYTAIGDNTTLAEDLQDENKHYLTNIIISEFTYERVKDSVIVRELDSIRIKGHDKPIKIYELMDVTKQD